MPEWIQGRPTLYTPPVYTSIGCNHGPENKHPGHGSGPKPRKIDVDKTRRHMARSTPDRISRTFQVEDTSERELHEWGDRFQRQMMIKYGKRFKSVTIWREDPVMDPRRVEFTMEVELYG